MGAAGAEAGAIEMELTEGWGTRVVISGGAVGIGWGGEVFAEGVVKSFASPGC